MDSHFEQELDALRMRILEMAAYTDEALKRAVRALNERDTALAEAVIASDNRIDDLECVIDEQCLRLLALGQPMAYDLRVVTGCMRLASNLERVGDQAVNVAERAVFLARRPRLPFSETVTTLSDVALEMFSMCVNAFKLNSPDMAVEVCAMDARADETDLAVLRKCIDYMLEEAPAIERSVHTILCSRSLERVCDLATNIAEIVVFIVKGTNVKHKCDMM